MYMMNHSMKFKNLVWRNIVAMVSVISGLLVSSLAMAGDTDFGIASEWQIDTQAAATDMMANMISFHNLLLWIIGLVTLFVAGLLLVIVIKFRAKKNPIPAKFTHNTMVEIIWTVAPIIILVVIALPSFDLLYKQRNIPTPDMTIKVTGNQWYWTYEYPDHGDIEFDSVLVAAEPRDANDDSVPADKKTKDTSKELREQMIADGTYIRLLSVDNEVVVPINKTVRLLLTSNDVIHAWTIPSFGVKIDTIPGRLNEAWFKANREGIYYGQCSELCGKDHAYMPIAVRVVSDEAFKQWVQAQNKSASNSSTTSIKVAALSATN